VPTEAPETASANMTAKRCAGPGAPATWMRIGIRHGASPATSCEMAGSPVGWCSDQASIASSRQMEKRRLAKAVSCAGCPK
jgi:hypothetical protein